MKVFIFMCLAFVAVQVSSAPTENTPTIFVLSSDGDIKQLTPTVVETPKENPVVAEKTEEKPIQIVQTEDKTEQPAVKVVELIPTVEKVSEQPTLKVVEVVPSQTTEQPTLKVVEQPAVKVEEIKQTETSEKPVQTIEITSTEKLVESPKKETSTEPPKEVKSENHDEVEKKDDVPKVIEHSSFLDQILKSLFGSSNLKQKAITSSPRVVEISIERIPSQPKLPEISFQDYSESDDDDDMKVTFVPRHEETRQSSMLPSFLSMFNTFGSFPSIFGYDTPTRSSYTPAPRSSIFDFGSSSRSSSPRSSSIFDFGSSSYSPAPRRSIFDFSGPSYHQEPRPRFFFM